MKNVLLVYRSGIAINEFKESFNKYKKHQITAIVENKITRNLMKYFYSDILFITIEELFKGKIDNMQFDYIVGNPPYQDKKSSDAGSLYIDITKKMLNLLSKDGIIDFLTPSTIAQVKKTGFTLSNQNGLKIVDYTANSNFSESIYIIRWQIDKSYNGDVTIINSDGSISKRKYTDIMVDEKDILAFKMFERIKNNKSKLFVGDQSSNNKRQQNQDDTYIYKIHVNYIKNKVEYTWKKPKLYGRKKLVVHMGKTYNSSNFLISDEDFGQYQNCIDITDYTDTEIDNLKSFLYNNITIMLCKKYRELYKTGMNNILYTFPIIDVSRKYNEKITAKVFNLSSDEIKYLKS